MFEKLKQAYAVSPAVYTIIYSFYCGLKTEEMLYMQILSLQLHWTVNYMTQMVNFNIWVFF